MERNELVIAAMSPARDGVFSPVQVQKLFFLLDENISAQTKGPHFRFEPYDYGPFDAKVYRVLESLEEQGLVAITPSNRWASRTYRLTGQGVTKGQQALKRLPAEVQTYIDTIVQFVRSLSFAELVSAIYSAYPKMKVNSVFYSGNP